MSEAACATAGSLRDTPKGVAVPQALITRRRSGDGFGMNKIVPPRKFAQTAGKRSS
jgi:hypothetical protein